MTRPGTDPGVESANCFLRRADWRFLLRNVSPARSVCDSPHDLVEAVRHISGHVYASLRAPQGECDFVALRDPDPPALARAYDILRPGGECYVEYSATVARSGARAALGRAGFEDARAYWPWPSRAACDAWISMDAPSVAAAYLRRRDEAAGPRVSIRRRVRRAAAMARARFGLTGAVSVTAVKPGHDTTHGEPPLLEWIKRDWQAWGLGATPAHVHLTLQTAGRRSVNKAVALVYGDRGREPGIVVKFARTPEAAAGLSSEASMLESLQAAPVMPPGVPRVLFSRHGSGVTAVGESALPAVGIGVVDSDDRYAEVSVAATEWLIAFAAATRGPVCDHRDMTGAAIARFGEAFTTVAPPALIQAITACCAALPPLPAVCEHRDFSPWNVCLNPGGLLSVFDWESSVAGGVPGLDLVYFLSHVSMEREALHGRAAYRGAWTAATRTAAMNHECLNRYADATSVPRTALGPLRLLTWLIHAPSESSRIMTDTPAAAVPDALREALFLSFIEEELCAHARRQ